MKKTSSVPPKIPWVKSPDWYKKDFVTTVDRLVQSGLSFAAAYRCIAEDLHAQGGSISASYMPRLYRRFKQDVAVQDALEERLRRAPRGGAGSFRAHRVETLTEPLTSARVIRTNKAILEFFYRGQALTPSEPFLQSRREAISALSLPEYKKKVLSLRYDPTEPELEMETEATYWKLDHVARAICRKLSETPESKQFWDLVWEGHIKALTSNIAEFGWRRNSGILRSHYEETGDTHAPGAVLGAIEAVEGPIEDIATIPTWVRLAARKNATRAHRRLPTKGRGKQQELTAAEVKENKRASGLAWIHEKRALASSQKRWKQYQAETEGITNPQLLYDVARKIADKKFRRNTPVMIRARELYWQEVHHDARWPKHRVDE